MSARNNQIEHHPSLKKSRAAEKSPEKSINESNFAFKSKKSKIENSQASAPEKIGEESFGFSSTESPKTANPPKSASAQPTQIDIETVKAPVAVFSQTAQTHEPKNETRRAEKRNFKENWLIRRGHALSFALLFLFTVVLYFRPYELIPGLESLSSMALYLALATLLVFVPSQLSAEGNLTARPPEINWALLLTMCAIISIPIARDPGIAWASFNDTFIKVILMFVVMINVVRTEKRLRVMILLALAVGVMLSFEVIKNYSSGNLSVEGYRAMADVRGMFGNPNAQAMHFVSIIPLGVALAFAARNFLAKLFYIALTILFVAGNVLTFSRGGFLGMIVVGLVLAWKIGRESRVKVMFVSAVICLIFIALAPGNYGLRILSIFIPALDPVGSSNQRRDLLWTSVIVTLRNPWGIGMMNFPLTNPWGLVTHNSYTQVSAEMGVFALVCYLMLLVKPFKRLLWIERELYENDGKKSRLYYLTIGLQASLAGFAIASFFDSAAYQWFLYYLVAYAVCLRRVYQINREAEIPRHEPTFAANFRTAN